MESEPSHLRPLSRSAVLRVGLRAGLLGAGLALLCLAGGGLLLAWNALVFVVAGILPVTFCEYKALQRPFCAKRVCGFSLLAFLLALFALAGSLLQAIYLTQRWSTNASGLAALQVGINGLSAADPLLEVALPIGFLTVAIGSGLVWRLLSQWDHDVRREDDARELLRGLVWTLVSLAGLGISLLLVVLSLDASLAAGLIVLAGGGVFGGLCLAAYYVLVDRVADVVEAT